MTINDVMIRELAAAEKAEREAAARKPVEGERMVSCAVVAAGILGVVLGIFLAWCAFAETPHVYPANARRGNFFNKNTDPMAMNSAIHGGGAATIGATSPPRLGSCRGRHLRLLETSMAFFSAHP